MHKLIAKNRWQSTIVVAQSFFSSKSFSLRVLVTPQCGTPATTNYVWDTKTWCCCAIISRCSRFRQIDLKLLFLPVVGPGIHSLLFGDHVHRGFRIEMRGRQQHGGSGQYGRNEACSQSEHVEQWHRAAVLMRNTLKRFSCAINRKRTDNLKQIEVHSVNAETVAKR